jgi:hypothetical protein
MQLILNTYMASMANVSIGGEKRGRAERLGYPWLFPLLRTDNLPPPNSLAEKK